MTKLPKPVIFSLVLVILSTLSISLRYWLDDPENVPAGDSVWELHWEFTISENAPDAIVRLATPIDTRNLQVFEQNIALQGMRIRRSRISKDGTREIVARIVREEEATMMVTFAIHMSPLGIPHFVKKTDSLSAERRQIYTSADETLPVGDEVVVGLLQQLTNDIEEPTAIFNALFDYCTSKVKTDEQENLSDVITVINAQSGSVLGKARLLTTLARAANIPARIVMGLVLEEENDVQPHFWVEINVQDEWLAYDPNEGYVKEVPITFLPIRKNGEQFIQLPPPLELHQRYIEITKRDVGIDFFTQIEKSLSDILDLNRLSLSTRQTLAFLLLLPLGALFTVFFRKIIGPNVYGTFTPTFLALAILHVGWITGAIIVSIVTVIGIIGRSYTKALGLDRVSRLTMVFILVAIAMIFSVSVMVYYGLVPDGSIVLLPIVILTFMIDRIYTLADSDGVKVASIRLGWTIVVSAFVLTILQWDIFGLWLLSYPEAHLVTLALVILINRYKSKKWLQLAGLDWLLEPEKPKTGKKPKKPEEVEM